MNLKKRALIFLLAILVLAVFIRTYSLLEAVNEKDQSQQIVEIRSGMSGRDISNLLAEEGLIKSADVFYLLIRVKNSNLRSGHYGFSPADDAFSILESLEKGDELQFQLTVPEGFTIREIIERLAGLERPDYQRHKLAEAFNDQAQLLNFEEAQLQREEIIEAAEGLVIPDTYRFPLSYSEEQLVRDLINNFNRQRLPQLREAAAESEYDAYQLLIIASLIETEGKLDSENEIIASVIYNRLDRGMPLQLDATVQYVLPERKSRLFYVDLEVESPYNTYQIDQLPPAPIANPGTRALLAAIEPAESDYLFYFARDDGSHVFTESYQQHLEKQRQLD
ncbi:endolytic transglycosylase MltG [Halanaerobium hydrogeniformans]|uniref:Endolytic murein transglycosylase n=1 Tax=Halanaerobium hydrogeniformans TaxID=656519 RepID=E4RLH0_HALHG|nr:endolytic transglycosylase MltG [Halanaerobium hydrogeniformans]ADQ14884.1 aminodeoxychorismate lyase [Halanaerobium hydrogeniformans]